MIEPTMYQHFRAKNDGAGNPRRCFVVYGPQAQIIEVIDEGYEGRPRHLATVPQLPTIDVDVARYREFLRIEEGRRLRKAVVDAILDV